VNPLLAIFLVASFVPQILLLLGMALGIFLFIRAFPARQRSHSLATNGISKTGKVAPGSVRVTGAASSVESFDSPVTGAPCLAYQVAVWVEHRTDDTRTWELVLEEERCCSFWLDDGSGKLRIEPQNAELDLPQTFERVFDDGILPADLKNPAQLRGLLERLKLHGTERVRVHERCLQPGARVFAAGTVARTVAAIPTSAPARQANPREHSTEKRAEVINLSHGPEDAPLTAASMTQQGKIAAALQRARVESPHEWAELQNEVPGRPGSGRSAAASSSPLSGARNGNGASASELVLQRGTAPFVISFRPPEAAASIQDMEALLMMYGGPALALVCLYLLVTLWGWL
jgi:hypothetical protein